MSRINYTKYGISKNRYQELSAFVRQYCEFAERHKKILNGTGRVEDCAIDAADIKSNMELIEECLNSACSDVPWLKPYLFKNVTQGTSYNQMQVPFYERGFLNRRKLFFIELNKRKK